MEKEYYTDKEVKELWRELEDATMVEDKEGKLRLQSKWKFFKKGTWQNDIWHWFDIHYSKGVESLAEEIE